MRTTLRLLLIVVWFPWAAFAAPHGWKPLLEPVELAEILETTPGIRIIRVSGDYRRGHLPGSLESDYADWRGTGRNPGELRTLDEYTVLLQTLGITDKTPVVVVHQGSDPDDMGVATRVYWTLKTLGVDDVAVINGGFAAWEQRGLPTTSEVAPVTTSSYRPSWRNDWRATTADVEDLVASGTGSLLDARPVGSYRGLQGTLGKPGTIRGAANLEYESWFAENRLMGSDSLAAIFDAQATGAGTTVVSFCNTGHLGSINWFVISEVLGTDNARLYAESVVTWSEEPRPMDNQVGRLAIYGDLTARWLQDLLGYLQ